MVALIAFLVSYKLVLPKPPSPTYTNVQTFMDSLPPTLGPSATQLKLLKKLLPPDETESKVLTHFLTKIDEHPEDPNHYANSGNTIVRFAEDHMALNPASHFSQRYPLYYYYKMAFNFSLYHFNKAITMSNQYGAHYSLGLLLKLHGDLIFNDDTNNVASDANSVGYEHLCKSQESFTGYMKRDVKNFPGCMNGVSIVDQDETNVVKMIKVELVELEEERLCTPTNIYLNKVNDATIDGRDGIVYSVGKCEVYQFSHGCYMPYFRQFAPVRKQVFKLKKAFSMLQLSGGQYYHFLLEGLSRLLLQADSLPGEDYVLLLPSPPPGGGGGFIQDALNIVMQNRPEVMKKFGRILAYDVNLKYEVEELYWVDWRFAQSNNSNEDEDENAASCEFARQLLPPAAGVRLVRDALLPPSISNSKTITKPKSLVLIARDSKSFRSFLHEEVVISALESLSEELGLNFVVYRGGLQRAIDLFAEASIMVGVHGGGLANIVFCPKSAKIFEISLMEDEFKSLYRNIASYVDVEYYSFGLMQPSLFDSKIAIDVEGLVDLIKIKNS